MRAQLVPKLSVALLLFVLGCSSKPKEVVVEMVASKDIAAGTTNSDSRELFKSGKSYEKGNEPTGIFLDNWSGLVSGKKVNRDLKAGEIVKRSDIVEPDGAPLSLLPKE